MTQLPEDYDSIFRYIVVVSQRAEQLINGAKPRADSNAEKPTLQAIADVAAGQVGWRILTQEELDAQRQAIVDQFRAEVADEAGLERREIPDVLPTGDAKAPKGDAAAGRDRDDELDRLQRLLGMIGGGAGPGADDGVALEEAEGSDALEEDDNDDSDNDYLDLDEDGDFDDSGDSDDDSDDDD